jgi:uncharacterized damage-inducible protein DinB
MWLCGALTACQQPATQEGAAMPYSDLLATMLAYNHAANSRLLDLAATLDDARLDTPIEGGYDTIRETFAHLVRVEKRWRTIAQTGAPPPTRIALPQPVTIGVLRAFADQEAAAVRSWLDGRSEEDLAARAVIIWSGDTARYAPWHALVQLCMHSLQHRSELAVALTRLGLDPGDLDFIFSVKPA